MSKEITENSIKLAYLEQYYMGASFKGILEVLKGGNGVGVEYEDLWFKDDVDWDSPDECQALLTDEKARHVVLTVENPATSEEVHMYISYEMLYASLQARIEQKHNNDTELLEMLSEMKSNLNL